MDSFYWLEIRFSSMYLIFRYKLRCLLHIMFVIINYWLIFTIFYQYQVFRLKWSTKCLNFFAARRVSRCILFRFMYDMLRYIISPRLTWSSKKTQNCLKCRKITTKKWLISSKSWDHKMIVCDWYKITMFFYDPINFWVIMMYISDFTKERSIYNPFSLEKL